MQNTEWILLKTFDSEAEARVVESFLKANGLNPQLLGVHGNQMATHLFSQNSRSSLRLNLPASELQRGVELLKQVEDENLK